MIKEGAYMMFYDEARPLYLETNTGGIVVGARLLQARDRPDSHNTKHLTVAY